MGLFKNLAKRILTRAALTAGIIAVSSASLAVDTTKSQLRGIEKRCKKAIKMRENLISRLRIIGGIKLKIFEQFHTFAGQINKIQNLPDNVEIRTREQITLIPYILFEDYLTLPDDLGSEDNLLLYLAVNGNLSDKEPLFDPEDGMALCVEEVNCLSDEILETLTVDEFESKMDNLIKFYSLLIKITDPLSEKLLRYNKEYERYIKKMSAMLQKKTDYRSIARYFNDMYLKSLRLLDLVNTELVIDDKANETGVLYELDKRVF